jgi:2-dehydro-3-deoxyphosphooctonate aldolase (KDO 8-P synthase)
MIDFSQFAHNQPLVLIAGPCVIESEDHVHRMARAIGDIAGPFVFKASFDKANRTSLSGYRGPGLREGLRILAGVKRAGYSILTDIHEPAQAAPAAEVADILQIPAFLCRQTDLLLEAGRTGRIVNIKKGQFVAPQDIARAAEKVASTGNSQVLLTERGSSFGYNNLVVDMRGLKIMRDMGWPAPRWRWASTRCSWKCTTPRSARYPTAPTPCASICCRNSGGGCGRWTPW